MAVTPGYLGIAFHLPCVVGDGWGSGSPWNARQTNPPITRRITNTTANVKAVLAPPALRAVCMSLKMYLQKNGAPRRSKGRKIGAALSRWYVRIGFGGSTQI
jgi:hypothetical protein